MAILDYRKLADRTPSLYVRAMLDNIAPRCYIETEPDASGYVQGGEVVKIIRDKYGIPVCIGVLNNDQRYRNKYDYISVERIKLFEPYDTWVSDYSDYMTAEEMDEQMTDFGLVFNEERCCWVDPKTGEEYFW